MRQVMPEKKTTETANQPTASTRNSVLLLQTCPNPVPVTLELVNRLRDDLDFETNI